MIAVSYIPGLVAIAQALGVVLVIGGVVWLAERGRNETTPHEDAR